MRLAAQAKLGYYAAHPAAIRHVTKNIQPPANKKPFTILDPCAGEGAALAQLGEQFHCPQKNLYAIELAEDRVEAICSALPDANTLGPADFLGGASIAMRSFSLIWLNPPFDDEIGGGGRVETQFLHRATDLLIDGGVMALICPEDEAKAYGIRRHFLQNFDSITVTPFPEKYRPYSEVCILARKLEKSSDSYFWNMDQTWMRSLSPQGMTYTIPTSRAPLVFRKSAPTSDELLESLDRSPLQERLQPMAEFVLPRPPLALGKGHRALLLSAGYLDGVVRPSNEPPHIVRGTCRKVRYEKSRDETENSDGSASTVVTYGEKIVLTIRAVDATGDIKTFDNAPEEIVDENESEEE